jgi:hypothetical protein
MKLFFEYGHIYREVDGDTKLGIGWYRHHKDHKWFGFTIIFYGLFRRVDVNFVSNYREYDKKINYWKYRKKK